MLTRTRRLTGRPTSRSFLVRLVPVFAAMCAMLGAARAVRADDTVVPTIDPAPIRANIAELASDAMNGRSFRSEDGKRAAQWVADKLAAAGAKPLAKDAEGRETMLVPVARMPAAAPNVVAWIPPKGQAPSGEFILVTAHFDHLPPRSSGDDRIYNGADDNASGVCGMIAVAEALRDDALDVGVVFVGFTGEEAGLVGSRAFVEEETVPVARIRGVFNMDMISRQPDGAIRLDGGPKGKPLVDLLVRLAPRVPIEMKVDTHPDWLDRSDQGAFLRAGVPAVLFSCEDHEDYHKVTDHADKADAALAAKVASLVAGAVRAFAAEMTPRFDLSPVLDDAGAPRRAVRVGRTMPNAPWWKAATRRDPGRGIDAALVDALAKATGWRFDEKSIAPGGELAALRAGEIDLVVNGASATLAGGEGSEAIAAIEPAYAGASGVALLVKSDSPISAASDLATLRIAAREGSAAARWLAGKRTTPPELSALSEGVLSDKVAKGELDALAGDLLSLEARVARDKSFRAVLLERAPTAILCRAGDARFRDALAAAMRALDADGTLATIRRDAKLVDLRVIVQGHGQLLAYDGAGRVLWTKPHPHGAHDFQRLDDGTMLVHAAANRIDEIPADGGAPTWSYTAAPVAPYDGPVEIHGFERLSDGLTMVAETGNRRIVEVDRAGKVVRSVPLQCERPDWHHDTRRVRKTSAGTYLVCHEPLGLVREYDASGKVVWEYAIPLAEGREVSGGQQGHGTAVFSATRLSNGNTLIGGGNNNRVLEVNPAKEIVWSIGHDELRDTTPGGEGRTIRLRWVTGVEALSDGRVLLVNTHAGPDEPQVVLVARDKRVLWALRDFARLGNDACIAWSLEPGAASR
jgi:hypothetical protein